MVFDCSSFIPEINRIPILFRQGRQLEAAIRDTSPWRRLFRRYELSKNATPNLGQRGIWVNSTDYYNSHGSGACDMIMVGWLI